MEDLQTQTGSDIATEVLGHRSKMLSGSKGQYRWDNPTNLVAFNANVCTSTGKIWYGDLDLTIEEPLLLKLAARLGTEIYVLYEMDARFENEEAPRIDEAIWSSDKGCLKEYVERKDGRLYVPEIEPEEPRHVDYAESDYEYLGDYDKKLLTRSTKNKCSIFSFYEGIVKPDWDKDAHLRVYVSAEAYAKMEAAVNKWFRRWHGEFLSEYRIQSNLGWIMFEGPNRFLNTVPWVKEYGLYRRVQVAS